MLLVIAVVCFMFVMVLGAGFLQKSPVIKQIFGAVSSTAAQENYFVSVSDTPAAAKAEQFVVSTVLSSRAAPSVYSLNKAMTTDINLLFTIQGYLRDNDNGKSARIMSKSLRFSSVSSGPSRLFAASLAGIGCSPNNIRQSRL